MSIWFGLLGPVRAERDGRDLPLGTPQQRSTLAVLLLRAGRLVTVDDLVGALWQRPPETAAAARTYLSRLRRALAARLAPSGRRGRACRGGGIGNRGFLGRPVRTPRGVFSVSVNESPKARAPRWTLVCRASKRLYCQCFHSGDGLSAGPAVIVEPCRKLSTYRACASVPTSRGI